MKANAPEKVYLHLTTGSHILNGKYYEYKPAKIRFDDKIIEYTRTEAFIEKACDAYCKVCGHYHHTTPNHICRQACDYYNDFRNFMKGE